MTRPILYLLPTMKHSFFAIIVLIGTCSKTHAAADCTERVDGAPCGNSVCNQGICLPASEGQCIDKKVDDTCNTVYGGRCFDVGDNQTLLSCRDGQEYVRYWNEIRSCASAKEGDSCTVKEYVSNQGTTADGHSVFGEAPSKCGKSIDADGGDDQPLACLAPYEAACSAKMEGTECTYNSVLGETKECGGDSFLNPRGDLPTDVLIGYNLCEKYGECWGDGMGSPAKCIRGDDVHYKCVLNQSGTCSSGSTTLSSVFVLIFMFPLLVALL